MSESDRGTVLQALEERLADPTLDSSLYQELLARYKSLKQEL